MQVLILGSQETLADDPAYYDKYVEFTRAALCGNDGSTVEQAMFEDLHITLGEGVFTVHCLGTGRDLADYDVILVRGRAFRRYMDMLKALSIYAKEHGVRLVNNYATYRSGSKLDQMAVFYAEHAPIPRTVVVTQRLLDTDQELPGLTFPCIMKSTFGAHGKDNHVVRNWNEVRAVQAANLELRFLLQRFIPNDGDFRLLIVGGEMAAIRRRAQSGSHLNNTSQGGTAELVSLEELPDRIKADAKRLMQRLDLTTAGADVLQDSTTGDYFFLEINSQPQLVTGAFLDTKLAMFSRYLQGL